MDEADKLYEKTKGGLFMNHSSGLGFLGSLLCNMNFKWSSSIPTACTDGITLMWNKDWFLGLPEKTRITVLAHELWHVGYMHNTRGFGLNKKIYNIAADHVINTMLYSQGFTFDGTNPQMDMKFKDMSTREVYDILMEDADSVTECWDVQSDIVETENPEEIEKVNSQILQKVITATTMAKMSGQAGNLPEEISLTLDKFLNPKLPWNVILRRFMNDITSLEYSFRKPSRRYSHMHLPGLVGQTGLQRINYYLDISGSVSDSDILAFNSEVASVKKEFNPNELNLITFDTSICNEYTFGPDDEFNKITVTGRGGTDLYPVMKHAVKTKPDAIIIFTDMYVYIPIDPPNIPIIWIALNSEITSVPYGELVHLTT